MKGRRSGLRRYQQRLKQAKISCTLGMARPEGTSFPQIPASPFRSRIRARDL